MRSARAGLVVLLVTSSAFAEPKVERDHQRVVAAWTFGALGATAIVGGVSLGLVARRDYHAALAEGGCLTASGGTFCPLPAYDDSQHAIRLGNIATGIGVAGSLFVATGLVVYLTAPKHVLVTPTVSGEGGGFALSGRF